MGRPFLRVSLGGVRDESELRGHRRTYVGAMPGVLINGLRKIKSRNAVILLDEVDKLGQAGINGDMSAALLEILDPEQNVGFMDRYLGVPFDLSGSFFIATANDIENLSAPLRDRLEIIECDGYTNTEKVEIAQRHLVEKQKKRSGLLNNLVFSNEVLQFIIDGYTAEAGVRELERKIGSICRYVALENAQTSNQGDFTLTTPLIAQILGEPRVLNSDSLSLSPGVALGLVWTQVGGSVLRIETSLSQGKGNLLLTGKLGEVIKESAQLALSWVKANAKEYGINSGLINDSDIHIHFPAGAVPKDGPSAGITISTALVSLFSEISVKSNLAMTGELSLKGSVLPIGGLKSKLLAAHKRGILTVLVPKDNLKDFKDLPPNVLDELSVIGVSNMHEVGLLAFN